MLLLRCWHNVKMIQSFQRSSMRRWWPQTPDYCWRVRSIGGIIGRARVSRLMIKMITCGEDCNAPGAWLDSALRRELEILVPYMQVKWPIIPIWSSDIGVMFTNLAIEKEAPHCSTIKEEFDWPIHGFPMLRWPWPWPWHTKDHTVWYCLFFTLTDG